MRYRGAAMDALARRDPQAIIGALQAYNALFPDDPGEKEGSYRYRISIHSGQYADATAHKLIAICPRCKAETPRANLNVYSTALPDLEAVLSRKSTARVWRCPGCTLENRLAKTDIIDDHMAEPYMPGLVPDPPAPRVGLGYRQYVNQVVAWGWRFLIQLENRAAQYRDDYWVRDAEGMGVTGGYGEGEGGILEQAEA